MCSLVCKFLSLCTFIYNNTPQQVSLKTKSVDSTRNITLEVKTWWFAPWAKNMLIPQCEAHDYIKMNVFEIIIIVETSYLWLLISVKLRVSSFHYVRMILKSICVLLFRNFWILSQYRWLDVLFIWMKVLLVVSIII